MTETTNKPGRKPNAPRTEKARENVRTPFGGARTKLSVRQKKDPNFMYRWFNDMDDRIQRALDAGYNFVQTSEISGAGEKDVMAENADLGTRVSKLAGKDEHGNPYNTYLMKIRKEFYEEDQRRKAQEVDEAEAGVVRADEHLSHGATAYVKTATIEHK